MDYTNKDLLKNNKNVMNAAVISRVNKVPTSGILWIDFKTVSWT